MEFSGRTALVTGAASGIGFATAFMLLQRGAKVALLDAKFDTPPPLGPSALTVTADITDPNALSHAFDTVQSTFGALDFAVNNAGVLGSQVRAAEMQMADLRRVFEVNVFGLFACLQRELEYMLPRRSGSIVNVASVAGLVGARRQVGYSGSKHAVIGITRCAALDYARSGIRINAVCPGLVPTPLASTLVERNGRDAAENAHPMGRLGRTEEIAEAICWLLSDKSSFATGMAIPIDGGYTAT